MAVLTNKPEVGRIDAALLTDELTEIYSTPTLKKVRNLYLIDCVSFTIAGVRYLYPESKHEFYSIMIRYNLWHKGKHS